MKTLAAFLSLMVLAALTSKAEEPPANRTHKIVVEVAMDGAEQWENALRNVENLQKGLGAHVTEIEVVAHGKGLGMLFAKTSVVNPQLRGELEKLRAEGVVFAACENTMKRLKLEKKDLSGMCMLVDSGVSEVVRKEEQGFVYLKAGG